LSAALLVAGEDLFELLDLVGREGIALDKMGEHRLEGAAEHAVEEGFGGGGDTLLFGDERAILEDAPVDVVGEGALVHETTDEGACGFRVPGGIGLDETLADLTGGDGMTGPDGTHDFPFGVGDAGNGFLHGRKEEDWRGARREDSEWITDVRVLV